MKTITWILDDDNDVLLSECGRYAIQRYVQWGKLHPVFTAYRRPNEPLKFNLTTSDDAKLVCEAHAQANPLQEIP